VYGLLSFCSFSLPLSLSLSLSLSLLDISGCEHGGVKGEKQTNGSAVAFYTPSIFLFLPLFLSLSFSFSVECTVSIRSLSLSLFLPPLPLLPPHTPCMYYLETRKTPNVHMRCSTPFPLLRFPRPSLSFPSPFPFSLSPFFSLFLPPSLSPSAYCLSLTKTYFLFEICLFDWRAGQEVGETERGKKQNESGSLFLRVRFSQEAEALLPLSSLSLSLPLSLSLSIYLSTSYLLRSTLSPFFVYNQNAH